MHRQSGPSTHHSKVDALRAIADEKGSNPARGAIAWVLSRGIDIVPLVGARKRTQSTDALHAPELQLTVNDFSRIETAVPAGAAAGDRYPASQMAHLDSEQARGVIHGARTEGLTGPLDGP
ncbi:pyridoxine 4-dehydrogenase [Burkholderia pyrrocinia]|uniref:Pyridoxine 4-dehydrogenase n=1 Tax=Burkholderia pyrrocinia TaxID=60550 RepID=A0A318JLQ6_BURPY|nr:pyridoxine 4-dehydrogenase [Burkholderia pyrrocinia]SFW59048.1 Aldo/keto reductase family protein [Burkholderia sp. NFACC33-1]SFY13233.1 Aldo/keto reductase family protein [Burkholderia sp. NFPP32]